MNTLKSPFPPLSCPWLFPESSATFIHTKDGVAVAGWLLLSIATVSFPGRLFATEAWIYPERNWQKASMNLNLYSLNCSETTHNKLKPLSNTL